MEKCKINGNTKILAIFGDPVGHTLSPAMYNAAFEHLGWNCRYIPCHVTPENLADALRGIKALNFVGANMTIPHKQSVIPLLDEIFGDSVKSGSVNTVIHRNGRLCGTSTDGLGLVRSLKEEAGFEPCGKRVLILGAGGTTAAIVFSLISTGVKSIEILNRNLSKVALLQESVRAKTGFEIKVHSLNDLEVIDFSSMDLIINTTSVGLTDDDTIIPGRFLMPHLFVYDVVYKKGGTRLLKEAETVGCKVLSGLSLLLYQGVESFALWFETDPPINIMREVILEGENKNVP